MKKIVLFLLALWSAIHSIAQKPALNKTKEIDQLVKAYERLSKFNGVVLVAAGGQLIYENGVGYKNAAEKSFNDTNTLFRIYSITKTFTSTVIFKLIEEKKLTAEDRLSRFYPSFPKGDSITIAHLLTHTSGIYDYTRGNDMPDQSEQSFVNFLCSKPLDFSPGAGWGYSNSGYWLLGFIIQKITGTTYEEAVKQYIFDPLKMAHSGFDFKTLKHPDKATGYEWLSAAVKKQSTDIDPPGPFAAGAIYSTAGDLYKYFNGIQAYQVISKESQMKAWTAAATNKGYGFGWQLNGYYGRKVVYHGGGGPGFKSNFFLIPEDSVCVIMLNNAENTNLDAFTRVVCNILYDKPYKIPFEMNTGSQQLEKYTGTYQVDSLFTMYITAENGKLVAQATGQGKTVLLAEKENYFYAVEAEASLEFRANGKGQYNELVLAQGGKEIRAARFYPAWGVLGDATTIGWDGQKDIELKRLPGKDEIWELKNLSLKKGEIKFRFNNDWNINYGDNKHDHILDLYGDNIKVEEGVYDIRLDLSDKERPAYRIIEVK